MTERHRPPAAGTPGSYHFPPVEHRALPGGGELVAVRLDDVPLVHLSLVAPAGTLFEGDHPGLATFTAELLDEGTERWSAMELAAEEERLGASFRTEADRDVGSASLRVLAEGLEDGMALLSEAVCRPTFPEAEIERLRRETLADLLQRLDRPAYLALDALHRAIYDSGPYARPALGTEDAVRGFDRDQIQGFYRRRYGRAGLRLLAAGDFDVDALAALADAQLGPGEPSTEDVWQPLPTVAAEPAHGVRVVLVDRPGAVQTELRIGHVAVSRDDDDVVPLLLLNVILGGKFTSRINLNLRERNGYTYGANSRFVPRLRRGPFRISSAVATESAAAAAREVLREIDEIRAEPVTTDELEDAKGYVLGVFPYLLQSGSGIVQRLETMVIHDLGLDYYDRYPDRLRRVTREDVLRVAREHLRPDELVIAAVGPADVLRQPFEELAPVTVLERN